VRITIETTEAGMFAVQEDIGTGRHVTADPEKVLRLARVMLENHIERDLALRTNPPPRHVKILLGRCPTCYMGTADCVGFELEELPKC